MFRVLLELIRVTAIFIILGLLMGTLIKFIYSSLGINIEDTYGGLMVSLSILIIIFVLYRNKLQFTGFYKGEKRVKLPIAVSVFLVSCSVLMLIFAPLLQ